MTIAFDALNAPILVTVPAPTTGANQMWFAAIGQPVGYQWRLIGSNLNYAADGTISGVISRITLVDAGGLPVQTISVDPLLAITGGNGLAGKLNAFVDQAELVTAQTLDAWALTPADVRFEEFIQTGLVSTTTLALLNDVGGVTGYLQLVGKGFVDDSLSAGVLMSVTLLDLSSAPVAGKTVSFGPAGIPLNALNYGLIGYGFDGFDDAGAIHLLLTAGNNTVTGQSAEVPLDGGLGNDALIGALGATQPFEVTYESLTAGQGVTASLALTTAQNTGGGGTDTYIRITNLTGSHFNDTLTGSAAGNVLDGSDGNDQLFGGLGTDTLLGGNGDDTLNGGAGADRLTGEDGRDAASYATSTLGVTVVLGLAVQGGAGDAAGDVLDGIEALIGSGLIDNLTGDSADNVIEGRAGADLLAGGGNGLYGDTVSYASSATAVRVDLRIVDTAQSVTTNGDATGDRLTGFENILGSAFNDVLTGDAFNNGLFGGAGNDTLLGGEGADMLDGGAGTGDTASYAASVDGVFVDLLYGANGGDAEGDVLLWIENLTGSNADDTLYGNGGANVLNGGGGNDLIDGDTGNDTLIGGANDTVGDTLSYYFASTAVTVSLAVTTAQNTGGSGVDLISGFENLEGSDYNDVLTGTLGQNFLDGGFGNDLLFGGAGYDSLYGGSGDDTLVGGALYDDLYGSDDNEIIGDTVSYATSAAGVTVFLGDQVAGEFQISSGDADDDFLQGIENLTGSALIDRLTGNDADNIIEGRAGADVLEGGFEDVVGDTVSYAASAAGVRVNIAIVLQSATTNGDAAGDSLTGFENIIGSAFNDVLTGTAFDNRLTGGSGNDMLNGGAGADTLDGGAGTGDTASYAGSVAGVLAQLSGDVQGGDAAGDILLNIENLTGSEANDTLSGNGMANVLIGGGGDDVVDGGAGNDTLTGGTHGPGGDTLGYVFASAGVTVSLAVITAQITGGGGTDLISGFENLQGSAFRDVLTGTLGRNLLVGNAGHDLLSGGADIDTLEGGAGDDTLVGGAGADSLSGGNLEQTQGDTASYATSTVGVTIVLGDQSAGTTQLSAGDANGDVLRGIENLTGSALIDTLTGNDSDNIIEGRAGADVLSGLGGRDTVSYAASATAVRVDLRIQGGAGALGLQSATTNGDAAGDRLLGFEDITGSNFNDVLTGDGDANRLTGGAGNDTLVGGGGADTLDGGAGTGDTASFAGFATAVTVNLATGITDNAGGSGLTGIENVTGGTGGDSLYGDHLANVLNGGDGDDAIEGGLGNDTLTGGLGIDTLIYSGSVGVTVSLATATAQNTGSAGTDQISGFENLQGTNQADSLTGSLAANLFYALGGNDTVFGLAGNDTIYAGEGNDLLIGGAGGDTLVGGGGIDTASYFGSTLGVTVNLGNGGLAQLGAGDANGDILQDIENLTGSALIDTLTGNEADNIIEGRAGADVLSGGSNTSAGDTVSYAASAAGVRVNIGIVLQSATTNGDAAGDSLNGFENIIGSALNDTLIGNGSNNRLVGGLGFNVLEGGAGADTLDGSAGTADTASYAGSAGNVTVDLRQATQTGAGDGLGDVLIGIENLLGGAAADLLTGNAGNNRIDGGAGGDFIEGGAGNDTLIGGTNLGGSDGVFYTDAASGVTVSLAITVAQNTFGAGTDLISGFENLNGSLFDDRLTGDALSNFIRGNDGNDTLNGGLGNDGLFGGAGADQFVFNTTLGTANVDTMNTFEVGSDKIVLENAIFTALGLATGALNAAQFAVLTDTRTAAHRIIYDAGTGQLFYDRDGTGAALAVQFGNALEGNSGSSGAAGLSASDFLII